MAKCRRYTPEEDAQIRAWWFDGMSAVHIGRKLGRPVDSINARARKLGLPSRGTGNGCREPGTQMSIAEVKAKRARINGCVLHRRALGFHDPIVITQAPLTLFGAPIKGLDPETRALIDREIERRAAA
jgi:hypothetical protein